MYNFTHHLPSLWLHMPSSMKGWKDALHMQQGVMWVGALPEQCLNCSSCIPQCALGQSHHPHHKFRSCVDRSNSSRTKFESVVFDVELVMRCEPLSSCRNRCYRRLRGALLITSLFGSQLLYWITENRWTWTTSTTSSPLSFGCCMSVARRDENDFKVHGVLWVFPCSPELQRVSSQLKWGKQMEKTNLDNDWLEAFSCLNWQADHSGTVDTLHWVLIRGCLKFSKGNLCWNLGALAAVPESGGCSPVEKERPQNVRFANLPDKKQARETSKCAMYFFGLSLS